MRKRSADFVLTTAASALGTLLGFLAGWGVLLRTLVLVLAVGLVTSCTDSPTAPADGPILRWGHPSIPDGQDAKRPLYCSRNPGGC